MSYFRTNSFLLGPSNQDWTPTEGPWAVACRLTDNRLRAIAWWKVVGNEVAITMLTRDLVNGLNKCAEEAQFRSIERSHQIRDLLSLVEGASDLTTPAGVRPIYKAMGLAVPSAVTDPRPSHRRVWTGPRQTSESNPWLH